ncbi:hypothetical protein M404DRAFT_668465 [Pisolithus tinctorius Marx 270]|uniref:Uncharacterized protein n=1 Tax=Pisolithus tinctorius Marx 270 TaxID=870435 RepID=A0A0C3P554_PISTI|nr:hypothetical protein M404DRAFT_668465 [Pisolithus tinctorius Marx 270]
MITMAAKFAIEVVQSGGSMTGTVQQLRNPLPTINPNMLWNISTNKVPTLLPNWITDSTNVIAKFSTALATNTPECARDAPIQASECPKVVRGDIREAVMMRLLVQPWSPRGSWFIPLCRPVASQVRHKLEPGVTSQTYWDHKN